MLANYEIYSVCTDTVVASVTIDVSTDPDSFDNRSVALCSWGYDPYEDITEDRQPIYRALFEGYEGGVTEVPVVLIEALEQLMTDVPFETLRRTGVGRTLCLRLRRVSKMLVESGCIKHADVDVNPVRNDWVKQKYLDT